MKSKLKPFEVFISLTEIFQVTSIFLDPHLQQSARIDWLKSKQVGHFNLLLVDFQNLQRLLLLIHYYKTGQIVRFGLITKSAKFSRIVYLARLLIKLHFLKVKLTLQP